MDQDFKRTLLRSSNVENDDENHHELLRYSEMKIGKVEPTMKIFQSDLGERHLTDEIHSYFKLRKEFGNSSGKIRRVR